MGVTNVALTPRDDYREPYEDEPPGARRSTWERVDLTATVDGILAGTLDRPAPTVGRIADGTRLFYRGKVNGLAGESGSGKTWTALHVARQELEDGNVVLYIDHEDDEVGIVSRLLDLGTGPEIIKSHFGYLNPTEAPTLPDLHLLAELITAVAPGLIVIDSTGEGLALEGANPNADEQVAAWFARVPRRLAAIRYDDQPGPAVVVLDHTRKDDDGGLWPAGSHRKRAAISGAQYMQRVLQAFDKHTAGSAALVCAKDRHGNYRSGKRVAELHVAPGPSGPEVSLGAPEATDPSIGFRPTVLMGRVAEALSASSGPLSYRQIESSVSGKKDAINAAVTRLIAEGFVQTSRGSRNATLHTLVMPFEPGGTVEPSMSPNRPSTVPCPLDGGTGGQSSTVPGGQSGDGRGTVKKAALCEGCGEPLDATLIADGHRAHLGCEASS